MTVTEILHYIDVELDNIDVYIETAKAAHKLQLAILNGRRFALEELRDAINADVENAI